MLHAATIVQKQWRVLTGWECNQGFRGDSELNLAMQTRLLNFWPKLSSPPGGSCARAIPQSEESDGSTSTAPSFLAWEHVPPPATDVLAEATHP